MGSMCVCLLEEEEGEEELKQREGPAVGDSITQKTKKGVPILLCVCVCVREEEEEELKQREGPAVGDPKTQKTRKGVPILLGHRLTTQCNFVTTW